MIFFHTNQQPQNSETSHKEYKDIYPYSKNSFGVLSLCILGKNIIFRRIIVINFHYLFTYSKKNRNKSHQTSPKDYLDHLLMDKSNFDMGSRA